MDSIRKVVIFSEFHKNVMMDKIIIEENMRCENVNQYIKVGKF